MIHKPQKNGLYARHLPYKSHSVNTELHIEAKSSIKIMMRTHFDSELHMPVLQESKKTNL